MSYLSQQLSRFLNSVHDSSTYILDLKKSIDYLFSIIQNGDYSFPIIDDNYLNLLRTIDVTNYKILDNVFYSVQVNSGIIKKGYNPLKITQLLNEVDLERLLIELTPEQHETYILLNQIYNLNFNNLYMFKSMQYLMKPIESSIFMDISRINQISNLLPYVYQQTSFPGIEYDHFQNKNNLIWTIKHNLLNFTNVSEFDIRCYDLSGVDILYDIDSYSVTDNTTIVLKFKSPRSGHCLLHYDFVIFPFIYSYLLLSALYSSNSTYVKNLISDSQIFDLFGPNAIVDQFNSYIDSNISLISTEVVNFILNNIFLFNSEQSNSLNSNCKTVIQNIIPELRVKFSEANILEITHLKITSIIINSCWKYISQYTAFKNLHEKFYKQFNDFFIITDENLNWLKIKEDLIRNIISSRFKENIEMLKMLETISYQFKENPTYFINSYPIIHSKYCLSLIAEIEPGFEISELLSKINKQPDVIAKLKTFITSNKLQSNNDTIRLFIITKFKDIISEFCESSLFTNWIIDSLLPTIMNFVNDNYLISIDQYQSIDNIKMFFKLLFVKHLLNGRLFESYISSFITKFNTYLTASVNNITDEQLDSILTTCFEDNRHFTNLLNCFFKGAVTSKYVDNLISGYTL